MELTATGSYTIGVLVADSNETERQLLVSALRRHGGLKIVSCKLESNAIEQALAFSSIEVTVMNVQGAGNGENELGIVRRLNLAHPEIAQVLCWIVQTGSLSSTHSAPEPGDSSVSPSTPFACFADVFIASMTARSGPVRSSSGTCWKVFLRCLPCVW
jgi:hypothetical protein